MALLPAATRGQAGSAGGSIGNDDKELSGSRDVEQHSPPVPSPPGQGSTSLDGVWIFASAGCNGAGAVARGVISGSRLSFPGGSGEIAADGTLRAFAKGRGFTLTSEGQLSGISGIGTFRRSDGCAGRWTAVKE
ncbi:MAG: hypothetical protein WCB02_39770 [Bradyrhizobium sp.]